MNEEITGMPCICCGICCSKFRVRLSFIEARRINDTLGLSWDEFISRYLDQYWPEAETFFLRRINGKCVFLGDIEDCHMQRCLIHPINPSSCKEWNPSSYRSECQEGLAKYWGLTVSSSGKLKGSEQKLRDFNSFAESHKLINQ